MTMRRAGVLTRADAVALALLLGPWRWRPPDVAAARVARAWSLRYPRCRGSS